MANPRYKFVILLQVFVQIFTTHAINGSEQQCQQKIPAVTSADLDTLNIFPELHFKSKWIWEHKYFWKSTDFDFESRFLKQGKKHPNSSKVTAFLLPFSHNDPGWRQTYETYFYSLTKKILSNAVAKLTEHKTMTFAWTEISFLSKWWHETSSQSRSALLQLVKEGRFEILTGGWVMVDEASTTLFALVNQLVEGHQWVKRHLKTDITSAWSLDAFGHGSTMPYLLNQAGIKGMMIQRVHYAWKHWFAEHQKGDFIWMPRWSSSSDGIHCHNAHYDLYPTKHSCGPHPNTCMRFDFRVIDDVREEHLAYVQPVNPKNLRELSDVLTGQYRRTASLTPHNVVVATLGGDFRFEHVTEWDQQFGNYKLLFDYINARQRDYNMAVKFGTLGDYFKEIKERNVTLPTFRGDLFPYADVIFPFSPAYWTGYYGTRPFWKKLDREAEDELGKAEILFTFAYNLLRQQNRSVEVLSRNYDNLVHARRSVALFQHHDGITGTSPRNTMLDYARKLSQAWNFCRQIQRTAIESIWKQHFNIYVPPLMQDVQRKSYRKPGEKVPIRLWENVNLVKKVVIFNGLPWTRQQLVRILVVGQNKNNVGVKAPNGEFLTAQINGVISERSNPNMFELIFMANLPGLSVTTYEICRHDNASVRKRRRHDSRSTTTEAVISCKNCHAKNHIAIATGSEIKLDNGKIKAIFDTAFGLLQRIERHRESTNLTLSFGRYDAVHGSGAYLLHPFTLSPHTIINKSEAVIHVLRGPVTSEVILTTPNFTLKSWILHTGSPEMRDAVYFCLKVNGSATTSFGEYFMRFQSDLNNTEAPQQPKNKRRQDDVFPDKPSPILYTDTNGLAVEKRVTLTKLPYQANHFPFTEFAFIQDTHKNLRLSLLADRSHGASSIVRGRLETIFDRRLLYDDARGMDEGVIDMEDAVGNYVIKVEAISRKNPDDYYYNAWQPSLQVQKLSKSLNHQPTIFLYDALSTHKNGRLSIFSQDFPDDVHLLTLQTLSGDENQVDIKSVPSTKALMILQRLGHLDSNNVGNCEKLNATLNLNHFAKRTNLVGTREFDEGSNLPTTSSISVGKLNELTANLLYF